MHELVEAAVAVLDRVRRQQPLIHLITNLVTLADVANATLAIGARPVMAHAPEEVEEIARAARALVLNLGTPSRERVEAMSRAGQAANAQGIPVIFDPVGVGASRFRRENSARLFDALCIAIVRGNAGEIGALAGLEGTQSGVDTVRTDYDRAAVARSLAARYRAVVAVSGPTDFVSDSTRIVAIGNGTPLLQRITGAGDMLSAIIGASAAVESDALLAAASGTIWFGVASECAARRGAANGTGSFRVALLDALSNLNAETIQRDAKLWEYGKAVTG
jgi:hydroxyethylthiazole kinase